MGRGRSWMRGLRFAVVAALFAALLAAPLAEAKKPRKKLNREVEVSRSEGGIPSIKARSWRGVGFGYGYSFAEDNICTIADSYVTVRAQRSRFFGPDETSPEGERNLDSDFFYQRIKDRGTVEELRRLKPPLGAKRAGRKLVRGYVQGYNRYLRRTGVENIPDPRCRGAEWVRPISLMDAYRRFYELVLYASSGVAIDGIANAQPPGAPQPTRQPSEKEVEKLGEELDLSEDTGSNAWGLGSETTRNGRGIVLANPHFPWDGPRRFYQAHLRLPGKLNVSGASLYGVPLILIGHTRELAWSHTVSTAYRFTPYQLQLDPSNPTRYIVDGQSRPMERDQVTVQVRQPNGQLAPETRTLYTTEYGPITTSIQGQNLFGWTNSTAFALFDANAENVRLLNHFIDTNRAQSSPELLRILQKYEGIPWVNTVASDSKGRALYADIGSIPNVPDSKATSCSSSLGQITFPSLGLPTLDGSRSECAPEQAEGALAKGVLPDSQMPHLMRRDYVANGNDSYWLTNPEQPLEGYPRIIGDERTRRSLRTRVGLDMIRKRLAGEDGKPGDRFRPGQVRAAVFQNRHYAGQLWRDELVRHCRDNPVMNGSSGPVDVSEACEVLARWDRKVNLESRGALLFTRFMDRFSGSNADHFRVPFDVNRPIDTPAGLNTNASGLEPALADAVSDLQAAGIALNAPYGEYHWDLRGEERIPIHGGEGGQGVFNAISDRWEDGVGYNDVVAGSSFVMVSEVGSRCPKDRSILTYGLSENPDSPFFVDQSRMFSEKRWIDPPFCASEVNEQSQSKRKLRTPKPGKR
jgi:acyl-homoserine-lactone acylase